MTPYIADHWHGRQSLGWSFWVNLVGIRFVVFGLQDSLGQIPDVDYSDYRNLVLFGIVAFHIVLLVWGITGVVRSAENHFAENGNMALVWGAQLGAVLLFVLTALYSLEAVQMTMATASKPGDNPLHNMAQQHANEYTLKLSDSNDVLFVDGTIELGMTRAVRALLQEPSTIHTVVLNSQGGNIYEARGLSQLFSDKSVATHVSERCASACTIAFVGGVRRTAGPGASFGFHQYRVDASYTIIVTDVTKEQRRDQQRLLSAGVDSGFVDSVFEQPSSSMWWPALAVLRDAKFLGAIEPLSTKAGSALEMQTDLAPE